LRRIKPGYACAIFQAGKGMRIVVGGLVKRFGDVAAVDGVDLDIADGELFTLLGPSGCGKSTLLRLIAGFAAPDAGTLRFGDQVMNAVPPEDRGIGMVFQNYALWPHMSVFDNIAYGLRLRRIGRAAVATRVADVMHLVDLRGLAERFPGQLSGGQQQRVALARALVLDPRMLLLDEPLSNLDARVRVQVRAGIRQLQQRLGITTVYVTHDQEEALALSDRLAVMERGRVRQVDHPRVVYQRPADAFVADFIGANNLLAGIVRSRDGQGLLTIRTGSGPLVTSGVPTLAPGDACVACVRPENFRIEAGDSPIDGAVNRLEGEVRFGAYLGHVVRYDVALAEGVVVKVDVPEAFGHAPLAPGARLALRFDPAAAWAIPVEAAR